MNRKRDQLTDVITLRIGPALRAEVDGLRDFLAAHDGRGHIVGVSVRGGRQTLFCSCGVPSAAMREDDLKEST